MPYGAVKTEEREDEVEFGNDSFGVTHVLFNT